MAIERMPAQFFEGNPVNNNPDIRKVDPLVKAADRFHNHSTMGNAFSIAKQLSYLVETEQLVLPMVKAAARAFPLQEPAFENAKLALKSQISLARPALELADRLAQAHTATAVDRPHVKP